MRKEKSKEVIGCSQKCNMSTVNVCEDGVSYETRLHMKVKTRGDWLLKSISEGQGNEVD